MTREKRSVPVKAHITPSLMEQLELFRSEENNVLSMSDFLFGVLEEHIAMKSAIRISKQKIGRRIGNQ
jgi:hypothetical protein